LGDLLERVFDPQYSCVRALVRTTVQLEPRRRLVERSGGVTMSLSAGGDPDAPPPTTSEREQLVWLHADGRYRLDHPGGGHVEYGDDGTRLVLRPGQPAMRMDRSTGSPPFDRTPLEPGTLVGHYRLEVVGPEVAVGRDGLHVLGVLRAARDDHLLRRLGIQHPLADRADLVFDRATGVLLRSVAVAGGEVVSTTEIVEIAFDDDVDPSDFDPPADLEVLSEAEVLVQELVDEGVDVSDLDPTDLDAVRRARIAQMRARHGFEVPDRRARHQPTGPPPDDEEGARAAITQVFEHLSDRNEEGRPDNIQGGENLGPSLDQAAERHPGETRIAVEEVIFLDDRHAVVWFEAIAENGPRVTQEGRALLLGGGWKVARDTVGALLALAGVHIPPPAG